MLLAVLFCKDCVPKAELFRPVVLEPKLLAPTATLLLPEVFATSELLPTAVLLVPVFARSVAEPMAVFPELVVTLDNAFQPTATVPVPEVSLLSALAPIPIEPVPVVTAPSEEEPMAILSAPVPKEVPLPPTPASELTWFLVPTTLISASKVDLATVFSTPLPSATTMLSELAPVCRPVMAIVLLALVTIVVGEPKVPPNFTSPLLAVSPLLALTSTGVAVVETPFTVDTRLPLVAVKVLVVLPPSTEVRLIDELTPFTVLTRLPPDVLSALLLMMFTPVPVTPLTVVVNVFVLEALLTVVLLFNNVPRLTDELTPFTLDTKFPPVAVKLLLLMIGAEVDVTPLTATVILLADDVRLLLLMIDTAAAVTPLTEVVKLFALEVLDTVVLLFNKLGKLIDEDTPFTVLTRLPLDVLSALLLMMLTPVPVTPFTVVVNVFVAELFDTVTGNELALVQVGAAPAPAEVKICPLVPAAPFGISAPEKRTLPVTSKRSAGLLLAIPTLPVPLGLNTRLPVVALKVRLLAPWVTVRLPLREPSVL